MSIEASKLAGNAADQILKIVSELDERTYASSKFIMNRIGLHLAARNETVAALFYREGSKGVRSFQELPR
jgi:hypothetical protein